MEIFMSNTASCIADEIAIYQESLFYSFDSRPNFHIIQLSFEIKTPKKGKIFCPFPMAVDGILRNHLFERIDGHNIRRLAESEGIYYQLYEWNENLSKIRSVLNDAQLKRLTNTEVDLWLNEFQDLAYHMDDVIDDLDTEALRRCQLNDESFASIITYKVLKIIPTCCINFTPLPITYGRKMSSRLDEITTKLRGLRWPNSSWDLRSNHYDGFGIPLPVDESKLIGREGDKMALVGMLLGNNPCNQNVSIVSIVGTAGIGKTALARVLYNEKEVKDHFHIRIWICVSGEFAVFNISNAIFQAVDGRNIHFANLNQLQVAIGEIFFNKKFLIVLDDVSNQNSNEWELLLRPFVVGAPGSKIIVTTRGPAVTSSLMNSVQAYNLDFLSNEDSVSLLDRYAPNEETFSTFETLESNSVSFVEKCGGLPLALIMLGRVLGTKTYNLIRREVLNSEIWNLQFRSQIPLALRISYYDLPSHLKQPFAYCSLFPKNYMFDKKELVLLWMAEGFLKPTYDKSMESWGREYFKTLELRSFFQPSIDEQSRYIMQNLINDMATSVAGGELFFRLDDKMDVCGINESFEKFRHVSFIGKKYGAYRKFKELRKAKHLRTFLSMSFSPYQTFHSLSDNDLVELLPHLQFLRVLNLSQHSITKIPTSIGSLNHIRYLNFSKTCIERLPEQVSDLYNLQSLLVCGCHELSSLPVSFVKLKKLRHLDISDTPRLNKMPLGIGGLTSLQTLSKVIIEGANGFKISELKDLSNLEGQLSISGLDKVLNRGQASDANLEKKKGLDDLEMRWSNVFDDSRDETIEYDVLTSLTPHHNLKKLKILFYGGKMFPYWLGGPSFDRLTELTLRGCRSCTRVPTVELLPSLEVLKFDDMQGWKRWSNSVGDNDGTWAWSYGVGRNVGTAVSFPCLREVSIKNCPNLTEVSIGLMPTLRFLHLEGCSKEVLRDMVSVSSSIVGLTIRDIKGLTQLDGEVLKHLGAVEDLCIKDCDELKYLWESNLEACKFLKLLNKLEVSSCERLVSLGKKEVDLGISIESVKEVILYGCKTLESYNCPNTVERLEIYNCGSLTSLTFSASSLKILRIGTCDNLRSFPEACFVDLRSLQIEYCKRLESFTCKQLLSLTSLEELGIHDCPSMDDSFPYGRWPLKLRTLRIGCLKSPMSTWLPQTYPTTLVRLHLYGENSGVVSFAETKETNNTTSFVLPPSLLYLEINGFEDLESVSMGLQHLTCLDIRSCPKLRDLPETTTTLKVTVF